VAGVQDWIARTAAEAARRADAAREGSWERENLRALAEINGKLVAAPPATFREACQWIAWFNMASRTYNIDGAGGQLDELLRPSYERDKAAGALDDDEAVWILACLLLNDTHYYQVGGPDADGRDQASRVSHLILDAADAMAVSCNVTVRVVEGFDESLFRRGVDLLFKHQLGFPRFSGDESLVAGLMRSGFDAATARQRIAVGCHWMSLPGREYTLNDVVKVNLAKVFEVAWQEFAAGGPTRMGTDPVSVGGRGAGGAAAGGTAPAASAQTEPDPLSIGERGAGGAAPGGTAPAASAQTGPGPLSVGERGADGAGAAGTASGISADTAAGALLAGGTEALFGLFAAHLRRAVACVVSGIEFHLDHQWRNEPELMLNLLSHGPIERGRDASHGGAEFYNMCVDGAGLATVADSFAALEQRVEADGVLTWSDVAAALDANFHGPVGERARGLLAASPRFGGGLTAGDRWARRITDLWVDLVAGAPARDGVVFIPGWFSWANTLHFGSTVGATPNGRRAGEPISHGANPHPGFRRDGALTALVKAVADVQPGRGNTAPLQLEVDPCAARSPNAKQVVGDLLKAHFALGGTLANVNIVDAAKILDAHAHPDKYPDLVVRVTGFTAYFANLSPEFRQLVVDRIIQEPVG
jgi:pyruvate-formate lyase